MSHSQTPSRDAMRYDQMVGRALLGVVREALTRVKRDGLPGEHHFYITFQTSRPGVVIPDHLRARYPGEMTIILQFQFWDLEIAEEHFEVTLSLSNVPERLVISYDSIVAFADPSVRFGLQFDISRQHAEDGDEDEGDQSVEDEAENSSRILPPATAGDDNKVVTLDAFRKKP